ncbi:hypothetical protein OF83DRAFT_676001 [Amylostereum chailletii]|nr:hypothetical protein OF83DRAFT_676001 [Amylostereum chailletii]
MTPPRKPTTRADIVLSMQDAQLLNTIDEELRDSRRVHRQGQEEDLREALGRMMSRVEELCSMLKTAYQSRTDMETSLALAQSNLKMSLANNEMLEDALKRNPGLKDVGWRRSSAASPNAPPSARSSIDRDETATPSDQALSSDSPDINDAKPAQDSGFFKFRFSSVRSTPQPQSPPLSGRSLNSATGHLTSASLPSLVPPPASATSQELLELKAKLEAETEKLSKVINEKKELEGELESLSQALFEEANTMVATERIKRAEAEEELREVRLEKEALRSALRLMENERIRASSTPPPTTVDEVDLRSTIHTRSSSNIALKSPPPSSPSSSSPSTPSQDASFEMIASNQDSIDAPGSPAPLYVPPPHLTELPDSRTTSPVPLPHPHRPSHLRPSILSRESDDSTEAEAEPDTDEALAINVTVTPTLLQTKARNEGMPPAPPPPSAADAFSDSPWQQRPSPSTHSAPVENSIAFASPPAEEMASPWA